MAHEDLKKRIKDKTAHIKSDLRYQLDQINWKEKLQKAHAFFKKAGKEVYKRYKNLPPKARRVFLSVVILAGVAGPKVVPDISEGMEIHKLKKEIRTRTADIKESLETKYAISDKESFEKLYQEALPLIQLSMFPTECLVLNPYADNQKKTSNTIGLGSFYYPKNGDYKSITWEKASKHFANKDEHAISAEHALDLVDGWYRCMDYGATYNQMFELLKGAKLNPCEFAAVATVMYNSQKAGRDLCCFVQKNYNKPLKCAQKIISYSAGENFGGIPKRHIHESFLYYSGYEYLKDTYNLFVKTGVNSKGNFYAKTSVTQLSEDDVKAAKEAIMSGDIKRISAEQKKITSYICKGGQTVHEIILENVHGANYKNALMRFGVFNEEGVPLQDILDAKTGNSAKALYEQSIEMYNKGCKFEKDNKTAKAEKCFKQAQKGFEKIIEGGHDGPDLRNDMAVTYYHLGEHQKCIDECVKVLAWGDADQYSAANFNAAMAYEALGNFDKAIKIYEAGMKNGGDKKVFEREINRLKQSHGNKQVAYLGR